MFIVLIGVDCLIWTIIFGEGFIKLPSQVAKMAVGRDANNFSIDILKLLDSIAECDDFSWANKSALYYYNEYI